MKLVEFKQQVADARAAALKDCKKQWEYRWIQSRGTFLATISKDGQCAPYPEADCLTWDGSLRQLNEAVAKVKADYPEVTEVYVAGAYDGADNFQAMQDGDYQPRVAEWEVTFWKREAA